MPDYVRTIAICGLLGAGVAGLLALPEFIPSALANQEPFRTAMLSQKDIFPNPFDPRKLVRYDLTFDDYVSTDVIKTEYVHKIGFGKRSLVTISHTSSGTYSTDALKSPYVRYPGIEVNAFSAWITIPIRIDARGSFVFVTPQD